MMKNLRWLFLTAILIIIMGCSANRLFVKEASKDKPNIILIMVDALRPDHLGCYGYSRDTSPNIDKLAKNGVVFTQAFAPAPATLPSTSSALTSLYPRQHQAWNMHGEEGLRGLDASLTTLPEILKENGYKTIAVVANGFLDSAFGFDQGFDEYHETWKLPQALGSGPDAQYFKHLAEAKHTSQIILPWIKKNSKERFFAFLFYVDPHDPYTPPPPFDSKFQRNDYQGWLKDKANGRYLTRVIFGKNTMSPEDLNYIKDLYDGEIAYLDYHIGMLINALKEEGILEDTIIILTADHGKEFMDHGGLLHGFAIYNEHLRVPLIISGSAIPKKKNKVSSVVRTIGIMPTILDLLNIPTDVKMQGKSLKSLMEGSSKEEDRIVFAEENLTIVDKKDPTSEWNRVVSLVSIQKDGWKLIVDNTAGTKELYNIKNDPKETVNLFGENINKAEELSNELDHYFALGPFNKSEEKGESIKVDQSTIENLRSLGYLQ